MGFALSAIIAKFVSFNKNIMLLASILQSVEFYVIAVTIAAMVVALCGKRAAPGPVREILLSGVISREKVCDGTHLVEPAIEFICFDDGSVVLRRHGLTDVTDRGAVSLAIELKGFDVVIRERIVSGREDGMPVDAASFILDFMAPEHYFITYRSELPSGAVVMASSLTLHNRPGIHVTKRLI